MSQYNSGTVDVTNGSAVVIGNGTSWTGQLAAGDIFTVVGSGVWYVIGNVDSDTQITLTANYAGSTASAQSYTVVRDFTPLTGLPYPTKGDIETHEVLKRALLMLDSTPGGANIVPFSLEHNSDGTHKHVHADRISTGTQVAQNAGEVAADVLRLPGGTVTGPSNVTGQSLAVSIDQGAEADLAAINGGAGQPRFALTNGTRDLFVIDKTKGLAGMVGNIMDPLVHIPFRRANDELRLSGTQTFTRASTATYTDPLDGLLKTAAIDTPRFERMADGGIGLLVEGASTNYLLQSEAFDTAVWTKYRATVTANAAVAPDGNTTADKLVESTATGPHAIVQASTAPAGSVTGSITLEAAGRTQAWVQLWNATDGNVAYGRVDLSSGTVISTTAGTISIRSDGGNRWRVTMTGTATVANTQMWIYLDDGSGTGSYTGDGTSGIYLWGAQLEALPLVSSYIPTTTATVTRAANYNYISGSGNFSRGAWTIIVDAEIMSGARPSDVRLFASDSASTSHIRTYGTSTNYVISIISSTSIALDIPTSAYGAVHRFAFTHDGNGNYSIYEDGVLMVTATSAPFDPSGLNQLGIGGSNYYGSLFGSVRGFRIYDRALTPAEIAAA